jgi:hypothetical protein
MKAVTVDIFLAVVALATVMMLFTILIKAI